MCTQDNNKKKLSREIKNLLKGNALKYERYKDTLDTIPHTELAHYQSEVVAAFQRLNPVVTFGIRSTDIDFHMNTKTRLLQYCLLTVSLIKIWKS